MKVLFLLSALLSLAAAAPGGTKAPLDEDFGYVTVRPGAHMFWVTYHVDQPEDWTEYPLIMWLQGGPGASGVAYGNFEELGPYFVNQSVRETAWTKKANVMFVDNPVGSGYSYVDDPSALTTTNDEIAQDLLTLLKSVYTDYPEMSVMPFFVYAESYGGKMTVDFALALDAAIKNGEIDCNFHGVALGDSWISPMDSVNTWGSFLYNMGFVNEQGQASIDAAAATTQAAVDAGDWESATDEWSNTEFVVLFQANNVNFYNVLAKEDVYRNLADKISHKDLSFMRPAVRDLYKRHVVAPQPLDALGDLMNGAYHERWNIPDNVVWDSQGGMVFNTLAGDFMKPVVDSVVQLLEQTDVYVAVFSGDLDLICDTPGTYRWIENMDYADKPTWDGTRRENFYVPNYSTKAGYVQNSGNFGVYTVLRSGHMVPTDAPIEALEMVDMITANAAAYKKTVAEREMAKKLVEAAKHLQETKTEETKPVAKKVQKVMKVAEKVRESKIEKAHPAPIVKKVQKVAETAKVAAKVQAVKDEKAKQVPVAEKVKKVAKAVKVAHKIQEAKKDSHKNQIPQNLKVVADHVAVETPVHHPNVVKKPTHTKTVSNRHVPRMNPRIMPVVAGHKEH